ncbi:MAG: polyprenyl synthetase family protein [Oscillibacter sp.]|jgi:geranylgeranyl pyrophosphate synthase|uniref:polyprenyl synthetase family protein n=1 Tax=uncultured Oscillibacter sp. TaxID=876091 RepID=UPI002171157D|nr:farnesyl diphosphate synthase [uncultured Oscillibacter sp.]MCI9011447.1 polyprenyl synthetase family protein [Oscillibacter sp.]MCI9300322.1 polyprenyl synthetase family protein [Oscillibacter sp.]MCI9461486.1 polyprenyl synthetase family protein [Oscillibacter sp.]
MEFQRQLEEARELTEARLRTFFSGGGLEEAMRYSLLAGGKRIRPILTMKFCEAAGGTLEEALDFGCGVEMLHTYSLIHDDLPCMDNDDLRRGMPTNHKKFGECVAILAGDALQAAAFQTVLSAKGKWRHGGKAAVVMAAKILAEAAGETGMCGGQYWDTAGDGQPRTAEDLTDINNKKTGALLRAACMMGICASMGRREVDESCMDAAWHYATNLGLAFQIRDDILDAISTAEELGKPVGSDAANQKATYVNLLGVEACEALVLDYTVRAKEALDAGRWLGDTAFLRELADSLAVRKN